jgi:hypothetical protein
MAPRVKLRNGDLSPDHLLGFSVSSSSRLSAMSYHLDQLAVNVLEAAAESTRQAPFPARAVGIYHRTAACLEDRVRQVVRPQMWEQGEDL